MSIQSILFDRSKYNTRSASTWATKHGYSPLKYHVTPNFVRARIIPPVAGRKYRMVHMSPVVRAVYMAPDKGHTGSGRVRRVARRVKATRPRKPAGGRMRRNYKIDTSKRPTRRGGSVFDFLVRHQQAVGHTLNVLDKVLPLSVAGGISYGIYKLIKKIKGEGLRRRRRPVRRVRRVR